jgi:hypothetical protein
MFDCVVGTFDCVAGIVNNLLNRNEPFGSAQISVSGCFPEDSIVSTFF